MNASLREGVVPVEWKQATVVPVPKVTPTPSMDKLRPVSLTPTLAKVAESFITRWMMADMESSLDHSQFGNRKGRSTNHYLVQLVQYAHQALQDGQSADFLAIDYNKAFDRVDITVALNKLLNMNVRKEILPWIGSFLSGRKQRVKVNVATSDWYDVTCGVPQGTKVGPVVFVAMVNNIAEFQPNRWKFVDDITVASRSKPTANNNPALQQAMNEICDTASNDHMLVNGAKCSTMHITACNKDQDFTNITARGTEIIPHVTAMKLLGVVIQYNLKWDQQIDSMVAKANSRKYFITILKCSGVQLGDLVRCYCTFVRHLLEYAAPVWHPGLTIQQSDVLEQVQRQVLRVLLPVSSYIEARHISGLPTLSERRTKLCLNFASGLAESTDFSNWLPLRRGKCYHHNLRNKNKLSTMPTKSGRFSSSPIMFFIKLLNNVSYILPSHCACRSCVSGKCILTYLTYLTYLTFLTYSILISHHVYLVFNCLCKMTILQPFGCHVFLVE